MKDLFAQVLLLAQAADILKLGAMSLDGTTVPADAAKRLAISSRRLIELEGQFQAEVCPKGKGFTGHIG